MSERIEHLQQLKALANDGKDVTYDGKHWRSAASVMELTGNVIHELIRNGLYVYEPKTKTGE